MVNQQVFCWNVSDQIDEIGFDSSLFTSVSDFASSGCFSSTRLSFGGPAQQFAPARCRCHRLVV